MSKRIFYGWWIVLACFIISFFVGGVIFFGFTAFFEPIRAEFGWSYAQISFAASLRGIEMGLLAPLVGFLVYRFGSRALIFCGTIAAGSGLILLSLTHSLAMFYGAFLLISFGAGGCTSVVTMTVVANWFRKKVGIAFGVMASGFGAGGLIVPPIVWSIEAYGWRPTLVILGLGMWALGVPLFFVIRNKPEQYGYVPDGETTTEANEDHKFQDQGEIGFKEALKSRAFLFLNIAEAIRLMTIAAVATHVMPYLSSLGIPRSICGLVAAAIPLCSIIGRFGFGWLGDTFDKRHVLATTFFFMGTGVFLFGYVKTLWIVVPFLLLFPPGFGGSMVLRGAIIRENFGRDTFGRLLGITMGAASIGGIIGPTLAGWVFDTLGSYNLVWHIFCGVSIGATALIMRIQKAAEPLVESNQLPPLKRAAMKKDILLLVL